MERDVLWRPWSKPGLEHLHLTQDDAGIVANGVIIGVDHQVFRLRYEISCDARWRVREVDVNLLDGRGPVIALLADGEGHWFSLSGEPVLALERVHRRGYFCYALYQHAANPAASSASGAICDLEHGLYYSSPVGHNSSRTALHLPGDDC